MKIDVLLGLQWGDEGKGKIVDVLSSGYDVIARFQGGPNAGHSLQFNEIKHVLHTIPSGIFHKEKINIIGNGVVIDPIVFKKEIDAIKELGIDPHKNLYISKKAHLIMPTHRILDAASEHSKGKTKIGSTLKGIGPTYMDKTGRNGLRVGDILEDDFKTRYSLLIQRHEMLLNQYDFNYDKAEYEAGWMDGIEMIKKFKAIDNEYFINDLLNSGKTALAEGAQGTLLDVDFGSYPFVTSSNTICAGACVGLGISPKKIGEVFGVFKAYCTRVGSGPFPTELNEEMGEFLRDRGHEYGATTGRPRRCGWLDLSALKYAIILNGVTQLIMTKVDVLTGIDKIKVCTKYKIGNDFFEHFPYNIKENIEPQYIEMDGWDNDITQIKKYSNLPKTLHNYIEFIEDNVKVPVKIVSVGPDRKETIDRE